MVSELRVLCLLATAAAEEPKETTEVVLLLLGFLGRLIGRVIGGHGLVLRGRRRYRLILLSLFGRFGLFSLCGSTFNGFACRIG